MNASFIQRKKEFGKCAFLGGFGPFKKYKGNPILSTNGNHWESHAVFNPSAWTDGEKIYLLYRAQGHQKGSKGTFISRIGLAESEDGINFKRKLVPIIEPTEIYEKEGGCEDPRLVHINDTFYLTYTAYDGETARLAMAMSSDRDLYKWKKLGLVFTDTQLSKLQKSNMPKGWSKSGAIYREQIENKYWMFFGDDHIWGATSRDLRNWEIIKKPILSPRHGLFDAYLVEPGPPPILFNDNGSTYKQCLWLGYNGARMKRDGELIYSFGYALLDPTNPSKIIERCKRPLLEPSTIDEINGQVPNVVFGEGLAKFKGKYFLYYGMADSHIGVAIADAY
ncbi:MAG: glycoside hydrolase family 130 protein [Smithella sp.]